MVPVETDVMVPTQETCAADEAKVLCIIRDMTCGDTFKFNMNLPASTTGKQFIEEVAKKLGYEPGTFLLNYEQDLPTEVKVNDMMDQSLGLICSKSTSRRNNFTVMEKDGVRPVKVESKDSADSGVGLCCKDSTSVVIDNTETSSISCMPSYSYASAVIKSDTGYVGLVNQAMTCYLNSLLQSLYMTPEFRNAVYRWEFDHKGDPIYSIPYQLQRLFLQLQTSKRRSVETTDITRSFGWDSSEAWQQHDVQELCRVMFDALEKKWANTDQSDLINHLYQGKMKDYVKCLECHHESARTTPYLDIPLVIRPFASTEAYHSVEKALKAFVEPETLEGNNQYWCETCNKKCNAHKGLMFLSFPYFLTLQLKRFDFDYTTMHRIKLNDMVTFPEILNLNQFVWDDAPGDSKDEAGENRDPASMSDDSGGGASGGGTTGLTTGNSHRGGTVNGHCSTEHGSTASGPTTQIAVDHLEDGMDESTDIGCTEDTEASAASHNNEAATNYKNEKQSKSQGQYEYELFSIMIHSGSAVGGHYYAYIKSFSDGQWYSFNDQHVTRITLDDIKKTYGGAGSMQGYYSSAYASSTNGYMLVYRKIDSQRNKDFMPVRDFPQHLKEELGNLREQEERETKQREIDRCTCKIKLFYYSPEQGKMLDARFEVHKDKTLREATKMAWKLFDLGKIIPLDCVRLVKYDEMHDYIDQSYPKQDDCPMDIILGGVKFSYIFDLLLETKIPEQTFMDYKPGGLTVKVRLVDLPSDHLHQPVTVRAHQTMTVQEFKKLVLQALSLPASADIMHCVLEKYSHELKPLLDDTKTLHDESFFKSNKVFIECSGADADFQSAFQDTKFYRLLDRYKNTISIYVSLPPSKESEHEMRRTLPGDSVRVSDSIVTADFTCKSNTMVDQSELCSHSSDLDDEGIGESDSDLRTQSCLSSDSAMTMTSDVGSGPLHMRSTNDIHSYISESIHRQNLADARDLAGVVLVSKSTIVDEVTVSGEPGDTVQTELEGSIHNGGTSSSGGSSSTLVDCGKDTAGGASDEDVAKLPCENWELEDSGKESAENSDEEYRRYFQATLTKSVDPSERALTVHVDKRITLGALKKELEPFVGAPSDRFKIYRVFGDNQEYETIRLNETLAAYGDDSRITIKLGQALKKGEYRVRVYQLKVNEQEPFKLLVESIFVKGMTVLDSKKVILKDMAAQGCKPLPPIERCRLRRCSWKNPTTIFADSKVYEEDIQVGPNWEIFLEVLDSPEKLVKQNQLALYVRRWWSSTYEIGPFSEIILDNNSTDELRNKISEVSGIDADNVEFAKGRGTFPCDVSVLDIQQELEWNPNVSCTNSWPLSVVDDGAVLYYRDKMEELAELTEEKRNIIQQRENTRLRSTGRVKVKYSPRKERALKIYTDDTPTRPPTSSRN